MSESARMLAMEARINALEARLAAAETWQQETDEAWRAFPAALKRGFEDAFSTPEPTAPRPTIPLPERRVKTTIIKRTTSQ